MKLTIKWFGAASIPPETKASLVEKLLELRIAPQCLLLAFKGIPWVNLPLLETGKFHLVYLSHFFSQVGLNCQNERLQATISKVAAEAGRVMGLPQLSP